MFMTSAIITVVSLLFTFAILGFVFFIVWKKVWQPMRQASQLLQTGLQAKAKVLALNETGVMINHQPQALITLEVSGGMGTYQTQVRQVISQLHIPQFQPGARLVVRYDPQNPLHVAIEGFDANP